MARFKVKKTRDRRILSDSSLRNLLGRYSVIDRRFQFKYTRAMIFMVCGVVAVANTIIMYFAFDYFNTVNRILLQHLPSLLEHLEREFLLIFAIGLFTPILLAILLFFYGMKFTGRFIAPIVIMREHMRGLGRGEWYQKPVKIRREDEFQELVEAYNYFYASLQKVTKKDMERVEKALGSNEPAGIKGFLQDFLEEKKLQTQSPIDSD